MTNMNGSATEKAVLIAEVSDVLLRFVKELARKNARDDHKRATAGKEARS